MSERIKSNEEIRSDPDAARQTLARARAALSQIDGVLSVGIGQKETDGSYTDDLAIVVVVRAKRPLDAVPPAERIPPVFEGYQTDVIEAKEAVPLICDDDTEYPIIRGGIQIVPTVKSPDGKFSKGTLGCIVRKRGDESRDNVYLLSCKHVLFDKGAGAGDYAYHPYALPFRNEPRSGPSTSLGPIQDVAFFENIGYKAPDGTPGSYFIDCATARINIDSTCWGTTCTKDKLKYSATILGLQIGTDVEINDVRNVIDDVDIIAKKVFKVGRSTGKTVGIVRLVTASLPIRKDFNNPASSIMLATNMIQVDFDTTSTADHLNCLGREQFAEGGDSGSLLVDDQMRAIGLVAFKDNDDTLPAPKKASAYACHIMPVLDNLKVCIPTNPGTSRCSCAALDGTGTKPVQPPRAELPAPDGEIHFTQRRTALRETPALPEPITITAEERDSMLALRAELLSTEIGRELYSVFAEVRRELGYLVRNSRPVKVVWHRHHGPAFLAHVLRHLKGDTPGIPHQIEGSTRAALLESMGVVLAKHGSNPIRAAIARHGEYIRAVMHADSVHECLAALRTLQVEAPRVSV